MTESCRQQVWTVGLAWCQLGVIVGLAWCQLGVKVELAGCQLGMILGLAGCQLVLYACLKLRLYSESMYLDMHCGIKGIYNTTFRYCLIAI